MDMKKQLGAIAVLAVVMFGAVVAAEPLAPRTPPNAAQLPPTRSFTLKPGEVKELTVKDAIRSVIEDPEVVAVAVPSISRETVFHMTGGKAGRTTLTVWSKDGTRRTYEIIVAG